MDFGGSEQSEETVYEVYILFGLSWSAVSIGTGAASFKVRFLVFFCKLSGAFTGVFV